ncbi:MAG TPA: fused MFS/spermidine synthase [Candidatus Acidoferrales bacterium]|nr:fused MFS/spermidine synthase [Candidatus Acidoferrales bacterium]
MPAYAITIFIGAFLLFQVEPLLARYILPWFGGTPAVWITCMLFFQILLVGGYAYAHAVAMRFRERRQIGIHLALVAACLAIMGAQALVWTSPITPGAGWKPASPDFPITRIFLLLFASIGLPYFILSTTGPLMQAWFARAHRGESPYRLYALSNLGSLLALVTYPFLVEPALSLRAQAIVWSMLFVAFAAAVALCARDLVLNAPALATPSDAALEDGGERPPASSTRLLWIALAAMASLMLLATTNQICQQVAVVPFLWVLPLALYLLTFIICFDNSRWYSRRVFHPAMAAAIFASSVVLCSPQLSIVVQVATYCALLFTVCMVCHGELAMMKPDERHLTSFYLMIAVGGAVGGIFAALIAPAIFNGYWEFNLAIWASAVLILAVVMRDRDSWIHERHPAVAIAVLAAASLIPEMIGVASFSDIARRVGEPSHLLRGVVAVGLISAVAFQRSSTLATRWPGAVIQACAAAALVVVTGVLLVEVGANLTHSVVATRNFYGALAVYSVDSKDVEGHYYMLRHGQTVHGEQYSAADKRYHPTTYYGAESGIGLVMRFHPRRRSRVASDQTLKVGAIGLGVGTIAAYGQSGDYFRFYEINPAVTRIALSTYFSYLRDSHAEIEIVPGDARLSMEREISSGTPNSFDVLVVDAFSGDAIPVHLLTLEAAEIYLRQLKPDGVLAIHISNRYLDLQPVVAQIAERFNLRAGLVRGAAGALVKPSEWILLARNGSVLEQPEIAAHLEPLKASRKVRAWTDDYSNLFQILK